MKTLISFRMTGENPADIKSMLDTTREGLVEAGVEPYCTFFDREFITAQHSAKAILNHAFAKIDASDFLFVVLASNARSEGMLIEIGYALAKHIPIYLAVKDSVDSSYVPDLVDRTVIWRDVYDLKHQIAELVSTKVEQPS